MNIAALRTVSILVFFVCLGCGQFLTGQVKGKHASLHHDATDATSEVALRHAEPTGCASCDAGVGSSCVRCCSPLTMHVDYLNWQATRSGLGVAILDPQGVGVPSAGDPIQSLDLGNGGGVRAGIGMRTRTGWDLGFTYTHLSTNGRLDFAPGSNQVLALLSSPASGLTNADSVVATGGVNLNVYDLEAGHWLHFCDSVSSRVSLGLRYANIDQDLRAVYDGGAFSNGIVDAPTQFEGFGGRVAGSVHWNMYRNLSLFGSLGISLLAGELQSHRYEENFGTAVIDVSQTFEQVSPVMELAVGADWKNGPWNVAAGYELSSWLNAATSTDFVDNFHGGSIDNGATDIGFDGFFFRLVYNR